MIGDKIIDFVNNTFPHLTAWIGGMEGNQPVFLAVSIIAVIIIGYYGIFHCRQSFDDSEKFDAAWMDQKRWEKCREDDRWPER